MKEEKFSYKELVTMLRKFNAENEVTVQGSGKEIRGVVVFKQSNFTKEYSLEARSYVISSDNKAFIPGQCGYSIFGFALEFTF